MNDTGERILLAALKLFSADGFEAVSVSDIAREVGITKGALYRHYPSKRDIFLSIVGRMEKSDSVLAGNFGLLAENNAASFPERFRDYAKAMLPTGPRTNLPRGSEKRLPSSSIGIPKCGSFSSGICPSVLLNTRGTNSKKPASVIPKSARRSFTLRCFSDILSSIRESYFPLAILRTAFLRARILSNPSSFGFRPEPFSSAPESFRPKSFLRAFGKDFSFAIKAFFFR